MATPREQLVEVLKRARIDAGFDSHSALAKALKVSRPVVSRAENPLYPVPSDPLLASWSGVTGAPLDKLMDLARRTKSGTPDWFVAYKHVESEATTLRCWSPMVVPGLLQTESYARALLSVERYTSRQLDELVAARMERQRVIGRAHLTAIIDAGVLMYRCVGSAAIMAEQCAHIVAMSERPDIALHVVPEGRNMGTSGAFDIAARDSSFTVRMTALEDVTSTAATLVGKAMHSYERLLGVAMSCDQSVDFTRDQEERWKAQI